MQYNLVDYVTSIEECLCDFQDGERLMRRCEYSCDFSQRVISVTIRAWKRI